MRAALAAAVTAVVALTCAVVGSAAQLTVDGGTLSVADAGHPCAGRRLAVSATAAVGATTSSVTVTPPADWPSACVGRPIDLVVADGTVTRSGTLASAPAAGQPATVTLDAPFTPSAAGVTTAATVSGWALPTAWSFAPTTPPPFQMRCEVRDTSTGAVVPGSTCTVVALRSQAWGAVGQRQANVYVDTVSTKVSHTQYLWLAVDVSTAPGIPGDWNWATSGVVGDQIRPAPGYACSNLPVLEGSGPTAWSGGSLTYFVQVLENRAGNANVTCTG